MINFAIRLRVITFAFMLPFTLVATSLTPAYAIANAESHVNPMCEQIFSPSFTTAAISRDPRSRPRALVGEKNGRPYSVAQRFSPIQKISVIVPTYRELYNGNVRRLVDSMARQKLDHQQVEIVFVVNNSTAIAANPTNPVFIENQKTLHLLHELKSRFNVRVLDLASKGIETNMGVLRQLGSEFAIRHSGVPLDQHVIVHMDADTVFQADFLPRLYDLYSNYAFDAVFVQRIHSLAPNADDLMLKTFYKFKRGDTDYKFDQALQYAAGGVATPQISSRASALLAVGGFPAIRQDEDFQFTRRLSKDTVTFYSPDIHVTAQDRARPDGFDARLRDNWNKAMTPELLAQRDFETPFEASLRRKIFELYVTLRKQRDVVSTVAHYKTYAAKLLNTKLDGWYTGWDAICAYIDTCGAMGIEHYALQQLFEPTFGFKTVDKGRYMLEIVGDLVTSAEREIISGRIRAEREKHDRLLEIRLAAIRAVLKKTPFCAADCGTRLRDPFLYFLAKSDSPTHRHVVEIAQNAYGFEGVMKAMIYEYPDWLLPYDETPNKGNMFEMRLLTELLVAGHNEPERYPGFAAMYHHLRGEF